MVALGWLAIIIGDWIQIVSHLNLSPFFMFMDLNIIPFLMFVGGDWEIV
jgi:hypothetical protein